MKIHHRPWLSSLVALLAACISSASAADTLWRDDFEAARKEAAAGDKELLIDFTGSDWCAWCIRLHKEVFDLPAFEKGVREKFIAVELDYPKDPARVSEKVREQNAALLKTYPIKGYPTVLLCDAAGKPFAATGYLEGGPEKYLAELDKLRAHKATRDQGLAEAAKKDGVARARALIAVLEGLQLDNALLAIHYADVISAIRSADSADETGFGRKQDDDARLNAFLVKLGERRGAQDTEGAIKLIQETLADPKVRGELRQQVHGHYAGTLAYANRKQEAIQVLEKAVAEDPEGSRTKELREFIVILQKELERTQPAGNGLPGTAAPADK